MSILDNPPIREDFSDNWRKWFSQVFQLASTIDESGTTANRPTVGLYVGRQYFDSTLGKPIYLKSVRPTVWVLATGVAA